MKKFIEIKGVGEATIKRLNDAGLDSSEKINQAGNEGLSAIGIKNPIAGKLLAFAATNLPAPATEPVIETSLVVEIAGSSKDGGSTAKPRKKKDKPAPAVKSDVPDTAMGRALEEAAARSGTTISAMKASLAEKPIVRENASDKKPVAQKNGKHPLDIGLEGTMVLKNPAQLRDVFDKLPNGNVPESALFIRGMMITCGMCGASGKKGALTIDQAFVLAISNSAKCTTNAQVFCEEHQAIALAQARRVFGENKDVVVEAMTLREAWTRLCRGYRSQIAEAKALRATEDRKARLHNALEAAISQLDSVESEFWMTEEQVGRCTSPLEVPIFTLGLSQDEAAELGLVPSKGEIDQFAPRWRKFEHEYGVQLSLRPPTDVGDHLRMVQWLRDKAKEAKSTPRLSLMIIRRHFDKVGWRYVIVSEVIVDAVMRLHKERTGNEPRTTPLAYDWLTRRWVCQKDVAKEAADKAYAETDEGKALSAFLNATPDDETQAKDSGLLISANKRR